jgi:hypothetical protein
LATFSDIRYKFLSPSEQVLLTNAELVLVSASFNVVGDSSGHVAQTITLYDLHGNALDPIILTGPATISFQFMNFQSIQFSDPTYSYKVVAIWRFLTCTSQDERDKYFAMGGFSIVPTTVGITASIPLQVAAMIDAPVVVSGTQTTALQATCTFTITSTKTGPTLFIFTDTTAGVLFSAATGTLSATFDGSAMTVDGSVPNATNAAVSECVWLAAYFNVLTTGSHMIVVTAGTTTFHTGRVVNVYAATSNYSLMSIVHSDMNAVSRNIQVNALSNLVTSSPDITALSLVVADLGVLAGIATTEELGGTGQELSVYDLNGSLLATSALFAVFSSLPTGLPLTLAFTGIYIPSGTFEINVSTYPTLGGIGRFCAVYVPSASVKA